MKCPHTDRFALRTPILAGLALATCCSAGAQRALVASVAFRPMAGPAVPAQVLPEAAPAAAPEGQSNGAPAFKDDLFAGTERFAKGASDVTEINMDPQSLDLVEGANARRAHQTVLSVVRTYTYDKTGMYNPADVEEYRRKLENSDWHCSVHTRDLKSGESTDVCSKRRAPDMVENAIITVSPKSLTFIHNIRKVNGQGSRLEDEGALDPVLAPALAQVAVREPVLHDLGSIQLEARLATLSTVQSIYPEALAATQRALAEAQVSRTMAQVWNAVPPAPRVPPVPPAFGKDGLAPPAPPTVPEPPRH